jgi:hypothetical protein
VLYNTNNKLLLSLLNSKTKSIRFRPLKDLISLFYLVFSL